jgi:hypothetical protein
MCRATRKKAHEHLDCFLSGTQVVVGLCGLVEGRHGGRREIMCENER